MKKKVSLFILIICMIFIYSSIYGEVSEFEFLNGYYSPALISTGGYCNLYSLSPSAGLYNPALYINGYESMIEVNFNTSRQLLNKYSMAGKSEISDFSIGGGIIYLSSQPFEEITYNGSRTGRTFDYSEYALILGMAKRIYSLGTGINFKLAKKNIGSYSSTGLGMDIGFLLPVNRIILSLNLQNMGFSKEKNFPTTLKGEAGFSGYVFNNFRIKTAIGVQNYIYNSSKIEYGIGMELEFYRMIILKAGINFEDKYSYFSFGGGLKITRMKNISIMFDYAFKQNKYLDNENFVGAGIAF